MNNITALLIAFGLLVAHRSAGANEQQEPLPPRAIVEKIDTPKPRPQIIISDPQQFLKLMAFFPLIANEPETDLAAGWEGKFRITFQFRGRPEIKVTTSYDDKLWSSGKGDKSLKPGLSKFLAPLFQKKETPNKRFDATSDRPTGGHEARQP